MYECMYVLSIVSIGKASIAPSVSFKTVYSSRYFCWRCWCFFFLNLFQITLLPSLSHSHGMGQYNTYIHKYLLQFYRLFDNFDARHFFARYATLRSRLWPVQLCVCSDVFCFFPLPFPVCLVVAPVYRLFVALWQRSFFIRSLCVLQNQEKFCCAFDKDLLFFFVYDSCYRL